MRISVGISGSTADRDVLAWCAKYAEHGDRVRLVHVYEKRSSVECGWLQASRVNTDRWEHGMKLLAAAERDFLSRLAELAIPTRTSVAGGVIADVLADEAGRADVLVVGAGHREWQDILRDLSCPVVIVPAGWNRDTRHGRNVAVLCGRDIPVTAVALAVAHARRTGMSVLVIQHALTDAVSAIGPGWVDLADTAQAEQLDMQVASSDGPGAPPIITEVRHDAPLEQLRTLAGTLGLVVLPLGSGPDDASDRGVSLAIQAAARELKIPLLVVPPGASTREPAGPPVRAAHGHDRSVVSA